MKNKLLRLLIIEDSEEDTLLLIHRLKKGGYNPVYEQVKTAAAMKKSLKEKQWDFILCNDKMPKFSVPSAIALLKKTSINTPLIIITETVGEKAAAECIRFGAHDYISKNNLSRLCPVVAKELKYTDRTKKLTQKKFVSASKHIEDKLPDNQKKYRILFDNSMDAVFLTMPDGRILMANPAACQMFGRSEEEICSIGRAGLVEHTDPRLKPALKERQRTGRFRGELTFIRKDGTKFEGDISSSVFKDSDGNLKSSIIIRDVTKSSRAEKELRESNRKFKALFSWVPGMVYQFTMKPDGTYCLPFATEVIKDYFGFLPEDVRDDFSPLIKTVLPEDLDRFLTSIKYSARHITNWTCEFRTQVPGKPIRWMLGNSTPEKMTDGSITWHGFVTDINNIKQFEERILKSEKKFSSIFHLIPYPLSITEIDTGKYIDVNQAFTDWSGYSREEAIGHSALNLNLWVNDDDREKIISKLKRGEEVNDTEVLVRKKNGDIRNTIFVVRFIDIEQKRYLLSLCHDITERKLAEDILKASEEKYRFLTEKMNDVLWIMDMNLYTTYVTPSVEKVLGFSPAERLKQKVDNVLTSESLSLVYEKLEKELALEKDGKADPERSITMILNYYHKDGSTRWLESIISGIRDDQGALTAIYGVSRDITRRRQVEEDLNKLASVVRYSSEFVNLATPEGKMIFLNEAGSKMLGIDPDKVSDYSVMDVISETFVSMVQQELFPALLAGSNWEGELQYRNIRTGQLIDVYAMAFNIKDASTGKTICIANVSRDITKSKHADNELKQFAESLEDANIALRVLMNSKDNDQKEFEGKLQVNINDLVIPYLKKLNKANLDDRSKNYVSVLENNLRDVLSPFIRDFRSSHKNLTPQEIQIIDLIKQGKKTKEIADMLNASVKTIETHRNNIRKKLNLIDSKINLRSHIISSK